MFNLSPHTSAVATDTAGRPREVRTAGRRLPVTALESVRDETAAYPLETGPRTVFVVRAADSRFRLVHQLRDRRWTVERLASRDLQAAHAA